VIRPVSTENASRGGASHPRPRLAADDTPLRPAARHCRRTSRWRSRRRGAPPVHDAGLAVGRVHEHVRERDKVQRTARPGGHLAVQAGSDPRPPGLCRSWHRHRARPPGRRPCGWRHRARTPASPPACSAGDHRVRGLPRDALAQGLVHQSARAAEQRRSSVAPTSSGSSRTPLPCSDSQQMSGRGPRRVPCHRPPLPVRSLHGSARPHQSRPPCQARTPRGEVILIAVAETT